MRIYTKAGELAFKTLTFPDGQPHFRVETFEREFDEVTIETSIKDPGELLLTLLAADVLRDVGYSAVNLDIRYLMGARMDRAIDWSQPFTLRVVARLLNGAGFSRVRILDVHSDVALKLIRNSVNLLPEAVLDQVRTTIGVHSVAAPDKGATSRVSKMVLSRIIQCIKKRDPATGALSSFEVLDSSYYVKGGSILIVDDICDGGGTFVGLAKELRRLGASKVNLFVTHGIFSKGMPLEGIDHIYYTDSYETWTAYCRDGSTRIPISMKDM